MTLVLSVSHRLEDKLVDLMKAVKKASTGARAGGQWHRKIKPALGAIGVLVDPHVRHGARHGWHYHQHLTIFCLEKNEAAIDHAIGMLIQRYVDLLARLGYRADPGCQYVKVLKADPAGRSYDYPAEHNAADDENLAGTVAADHGEEESLSPLMLAERAAAGDKLAAALFLEFSAAIKKTRSVIMTPAMAKALEIKRVAEQQPAYTQETRVGSIPSRVWTKLIDQNLVTTFLSRVESAGREHWPEVRWWALEQTNEVPEYSAELAEQIAVLIHAQQRMDDPIGKDLAGDQIGLLKSDWTESHGADLVNATTEYVRARYRLMRVNASELNCWETLFYDWAAKIRRRPALPSQETLPLGDDPPHAETVSHGLNGSFVGRNGRNSHHFQTR